MFTTRQLLPTTKNDVLPTFQHSNIIYQYLCHCDSRYGGRTSQRLSDKIKQHALKSINTGRFYQDRSALSCSCKSSNYSVSHDSAIGQQLFDNQLCTLHYNNDRFSTHSTSRSSFHLSALEATCIRTLLRILCLQKEFVCSLKVLHKRIRFSSAVFSSIKLNVSFDVELRYINSVWLDFTSFGRFPLIHVRRKDSK